MPKGPKGEKRPADVIGAAAECRSVAKFQTDALPEGLALPAPPWFHRGVSNRSRAGVKGPPAGVARARKGALNDAMRKTFRTPTMQSSRSRYWTP